MLRANQMYIEEILFIKWELESWTGVEEIHSMIITDHKKVYNAKHDSNTTQQIFQVKSATQL